MATFLWIIVAIAGVVLDLITSAFLFVWFSIGAVGAIIANMLGMSFSIQIITFIIVAIAAFAIGYPLAKKKFKISKKTIPTMEEGYIGEVLSATEDILKGEMNARIKVSGIYWSAINLGEKINEGEKFRIVGIKGSKLEIKGLREE